MKEIKITTEDIKKEIDLYILEKPGEKLSIPNLGTYMRNKGYEIEDYTIRRREGVKEYINNINSSNLENLNRKVVVFKTLDPKKLIEENPDVHSLEKALLKRDDYYREIASSASMIFKENKSLEEEINKLKLKNKELEDTINKGKNKAQVSVDKECKETIKRLKRIIENNINKEMANALLEREGILETVTTILGQETIDSQIVSAETDVEEYVQDKLMEIFE